MILISRILGLIESHLVLNLNPCKTAKHMWAYLKRIYYQENSARLFFFFFNQPTQLDISYCNLKLPSTLRETNQFKIIIPNL